MPTRLGILGFAHGHVGTYCGAWKPLADRVQLVAGWDHDDARLKSSCEQFGTAPCDSPAALLKRSDIDAVVIAAETSMHADLCEQAAAAGKPIVLQKPMSLTLAEADRIVAAVERAKVKFTLAWQMRVDPQNIKMRELVQSGAIGKVYQVRRRHCLGTHMWAGFENTWHVKPELNRGMWADDAAHPIDWTLWMFGRPRSVTAEVATLHNPKVADDNGIAIYRYDTGLMAEVSCSFTATAGENTTEIVGEKGVILQTFGDGASCNAPRGHLTGNAAVGLKMMCVGDKDWTFLDPPSPASHAARIQGLAMPILEFIEGKRPAIATAQEGRTVLLMTLASYESAAQGRRIEIKG
ncbi:MAG: Gfo/Idh/MocA family oxidoreductase [Planctomycetes bacterium]|nr:Gfo/Idh/MocA family oxidoreductase [Planctomycetota bacterium]